jgi:hypothetical protein
MPAKHLTHLVPDLMIWLLLERIGVQSRHYLSLLQADTHLHEPPTHTPALTSTTDNMLPCSQSTGMEP